MISNHHVSIEDVHLIWHPMVANNLLGYSPEITTFKPRTSIRLWACEEWPELKVRWKLIKRFGVVNARVLREDAR